MTYSEHATNIITIPAFLRAPIQTDTERFAASPQQQPGWGWMGNGVVVGAEEGGGRALREGRRVVLRADLKEQIGVDPGRYYVSVMCAGEAPAKTQLYVL